MTKIKILHYGLSRNRGGIEASLLRTAELIDRERFELHFLVTKGEPVCFQNELRALGGIFHEMTARRVSFFKNRRDLDRIFKRERFNVLHMHLNTLSYVAPAYYAKKYGASCLLHSRSSGASSRRVRLFHYLNRALQPKGVTRVAVSDQAGKWLYGRTSAYDVLPNGVNSMKYAFNEKERLFGRKELGLSDNCFVLGHVGTFLPVKNHQFLMDVAEVLSERGINFSLLLVGSGAELERTRALADEKGVSANVKFLGTRADLGRLYSIMDALVLPSAFEGFPNAVLEAQASGLPCLVSTAVAKEVALSDRCQILNLSVGAEDWATELLKMERESFASRKLAAERVDSSDFSVGREVARLERLYEEIVGRKTR